jgi:hypothetical protein
MRRAVGVAALLLAPACSSSLDEPAIDRHDAADAIASDSSQGRDASIDAVSEGPSDALVDEPSTTDTFGESDAGERLDANRFDAGRDASADAGDAARDAEAPKEAGPPLFTTGFCSDDSWCWQNPLPHGLAIEDVFAVAKNDVWAVGDQGLVSRYDGRAWRKVDAGTNAHLLRVFGLAANDVWIGGVGGLLHWNGSAFAPVDIGITMADAVSGIWGSSPDDLWVTDDTTVTFHYGGPAEGWRELPIDATFGAASDIHGFASNDVWTVGNSVINRWDGQKWSRFPATLDTLGLSLWSVWGAAPNDVWLGGDDGHLYHFTGSSLGSLTLSEPWLVRRLWGTGPRDVWAPAFILSSNPGKAALLHFDGNKWNPIDPGGDSAHLAIHGTAPDDLWAVGGLGLMQHWDGNAWTSRDIATGSEIMSLWASSESDAWAVAGGQALHWNGASWRAMATPAKFLDSVYGTAPDDVWAIGDQIIHYDGVGWSTVMALPLEAGRGVWAHAKNDVWVSTGSVLQHFDGVKFSIDASEGNNAVQFWGAASNDIWAVGTGVTHWDGAVWRGFSIGAPGELRSIWGAASNDVWAVGAKGGIVRWRGLGWSPMQSPTTEELYAVTGTGPTDVYIAGASGKIFRYDGVTWTQQKTGAGTDLNLDRFNALFAAGRSVWAAGGSGTILMRER